MESGKSFRGKMFIDATYEGDLMAAAGVIILSEGNQTANMEKLLTGSRQTRPA